jgi:hypothetical protein
MRNKKATFAWKILLKTIVGGNTKDSDASQLFHPTRISCTSLRNAAFAILIDFATLRLASFMRSLRREEL